MERVRYTALAALAAVLIAGTGTGLGQRAYNGIRIWLFGDKATIGVRSMELIKYPMPDELRFVAAHTVTPFVYPVGLPKGMKLAMIAFWPMEQPQTVTLQYHSVTGANIGFTLVATSALEAGPPPMQAQQRRVIRWSVGNEQVLLGIDPAHPHDALLATVRGAMQRSTPARSLAENVRRSHPIVVLGGFEKIVAQAELESRGREGVLIDRGHLGEISLLARQNRPLLDSRTVKLTNIPQRNSEPDYMHATYTWERRVALSAKAVRLINATLSAHGGAAKCACELLYEKLPNGAAYIRVLPPGKAMKEF